MANLFPLRIGFLTALWLSSPALPAATLYWNANSPNWTQSSNSALWVNSAAGGSRWSTTAGGAATLNGTATDTAAVISKSNAKLSFTIAGASSPNVASLSITSGTATFTGLYDFPNSGDRALTVNGAVTGSFDLDDSNTGSGFFQTVILTNSNSANALNGTVRLVTNSGGAAGAGRGLLQLDHQNAVGVNSKIALNSDGILRLNTAPASGTDTFTLGELSGTSGAAQIDDGSISYAGTKILRIDQVSNTSLAADILQTSGGAGRLGITKDGAGALNLAGTLDYLGDTTLNAGTLSLEAGSSFAFSIGASGVNNAMIGNGGTLSLDGKFVIDLSDADTTLGSTWTLVSNLSLVSLDYGSNFFVEDFVGDNGIWTSGNYQFSELTGVLSVIPEPTTVWLLLGGLGAMLLRRRSTTGA